MGLNSVWHWLLLLLVVLVAFGGRGKISSIMGDVAQGIKSFKKGMTDDEAAAAPAQDPFKKEEPKALDSAGRPVSGQATSTAQPAAGQPQVNKAS
jgi:sec-independent protein translocase protein TatA